MLHNLQILNVLLTEILLKVTLNTITLQMYYMRTIYDNVTLSPLLLQRRAKADWGLRTLSYLHEDLLFYKMRVVIFGSKCTYHMVQLLYLPRNHLPDDLSNKMITLKKLIIKYIGMKYIVKKLSCWNKCSVFRSDIGTVWCMFHEKHFHCPMNMFAQFWPSHNY